MSLRRRLDRLTAQISAPMSDDERVHLMEHLFSRVDYGCATDDEAHRADRIRQILDVARRRRDGLHD